MLHYFSQKTLNEGVFFHTSHLVTICTSSISHVQHKNKQLHIKKEEQEKGKYLKQKIKTP